MGALPAYALHLDSVPATSVTTSGLTAISPGKSWDRNLAFSTTEDLLGDGATTCSPNASTCRQVYVFQLADFDCQQGTTTPQTICPPPPWRPILQVTSGPGDPDNPSVGIQQVSNGQITTPRAALVAFDALGSYGNLSGCDQACQLHRQIFTYDVLNDALQRITSTGDGDNVRPTVSSGGGVIAFESTGNPTLAPHSIRKGPAGVSQVFIYDNRGFIRQITAGDAASTNQAVNRDGGVFVLSTTSALDPATGLGADTSVRQIFAGTWDKQALPPIFTLYQVTSGNADSSHPNLAETDPVVYFDSAAMNLPGGDGTAGVRIFSAPLGQGPNPAVTQYTTAAVHGTCTWPSMDSTLNHLSFLCHGTDPFSNGTASQTSNRLFTLELTQGSQPILAQMTGLGDIQGPISANIGNFFVALATTEDLGNAGTCSRQIVILDFFTTFPTGHGTAKWTGATAPGQLPPDVVPGGVQTSTVGRRQFAWQIGSGNSGSFETITTRDTSSSQPITGTGRFVLTFGAPDNQTGDAPVKIPAAGTNFAPLLIPGLGALCVTPAADGAGIISCNGGDPGGDVLLRQDHNTDASDPLCLLGCREGAACQGGLPGPHQDACPKCVSGKCNSGFAANEPCSSDVQCQPLTVPQCVNGFCTESANDGTKCTDASQCKAASQCKGNTLGVCNGPITFTAGGTYKAGGMTGILPINMELALDPGIDGKFCDKDDPPHAVTNIHGKLFLTTGTVMGHIADADNVTQPTPEQLAAQVTGAPFDCNDLRNHKLDGSMLAGEILQLDLPDIAGLSTTGLRDVIFGLRLAPNPNDVASCSCLADADCYDGNPCNGPQASTHCINNSCVRTPMNCDDQNPCTADTCDPTLGCQHTPLPDNTSCSAGDPCNGAWVCQNAACVSSTPPLSDGTPCDDGNSCNGLETCKNHVCTKGTPQPDGTACTNGNPCDGTEVCQNQLCITIPNCDDHNPCTLDSCDSLTGCHHDTIANGTPCGSGDICSGAPTCQIGQCVSNQPLPDGTSCSDACHPGGKCASGTCNLGTEKNCDDHNPCTVDSCDAALGCVHDDVTDGTACTPAGGGNGTGTCQQGRCRNQAPAACNDNNPCTTDALDPVVGCVHTMVADGTECSKSAVKNLCKAINTCQAGICTAGSAPSCNDGNACTQDKCDPALGCIHTTITDLPGVTCQLNAIKKALKGAPSADFHQPRLRKQLTKMVDAARKQVNNASNVDGNPHNAALRSANRALSRLLSRLLKASLRGKLDKNFADEIIGMARGSQTMLQPLIP